MTTEDRDEWIRERTALIMEGCGYAEDKLFLAESAARHCWHESYGDPQKKLF